MLYLVLIFECFSDAKQSVFLRLDFFWGFLGGGCIFKNKREKNPTKIKLGKVSIHSDTVALWILTGLNFLNDHFSLCFFHDPSWLAVNC